MNEKGKKVGDCLIIKVGLFSPLLLGCDDDGAHGSRILSPGFLSNRPGNFLLVHTLIPTSLNLFCMAATRIINQEQAKRRKNLLRFNQIATVFILYILSYT